MAAKRRMIIGLALTVTAVVAFLMVPPIKDYRERRAAWDQKASKHAASFSEARVDRFLADLRAIETTPLYPPPDGRDDCSRRLNRRLPLAWPGVDEEFVESWARPFPAIPANVMEAATNANVFAPVAMSVSNVTIEDFLAVDTSWMASLRGCDRWDLESGRPEPAEIQSYAASMGWVHLTAPALRFFRAAAWSRLIQGARRGDFPTAVLEVRHLGRLLSNTEDMLMVVLGSQFLDFEQMMVDAATDPAHAFVLGDFTPLPKTNVAAHQRVVAELSKSLLHVKTPAWVIQKVLVEGEPHPQLCAQIMDELGMWVVMRTFVDDEAFAALADQVYGRYSPVCQFTVLKTYYSNQTLDVLGEARDFGGALGLPAWMGLSRELVGEVLASSTLRNGG